MKHVLAIAAVAASLGGCAQLQQFAVDTRNFLADPRTQAASVVLKNVGSAAICIVSDATYASYLGEKAAGAHTGITNGIYTATSDICLKSLAGKVAGSAANVTAVSSVSP